MSAWSAVPHCPIPLSRRLYPCNRTWKCKCFALICLGRCWKWLLQVLLYCFLSLRSRRVAEDWRGTWGSRHPQVPGSVATCSVLFGFERNNTESAGTMDFVMKQALGGKYPTVVPFFFSFLCESWIAVFQRLCEFSFLRVNISWLRHLASIDSSSTNMISTVHPAQIPTSCSGSTIRQTVGATVTGKKSETLIFWE